MCLGLGNVVAVHAVPIMTMSDGHVKAASPTYWPARPILWRSDFEKWYPNSPGHFHLPLPMPKDGCFALRTYVRRPSLWLLNGESMAHFESHNRQSAARPATVVQAGPRFGRDPEDTILLLNGGQ